MQTPHSEGMLLMARYGLYASLIVAGALAVNFGMSLMDDVVLGGTDVDTVGFFVGIGGVAILVGVIAAAVQLGTKPLRDSLELLESTMHGVQVEVHRAGVQKRFDGEGPFAS